VNRVILSEWVKLRRKGMLMALLVGVLVTILGAVLGALTVGSNVSGRGAIGGRTSISLAQFTGTHGLADALGDASTLLGIIVLGVVAASVAGEFSNGTLRNLLVREPRRVRLLGGKLAALGVAIMAAVVVASAFAIAGTVIAANAKGYHVGAWGGGGGVGATLVAVVELVVATLGWGVFGAVLAVAFRSPVIAIVVGVVYALPLENILGNISGVARWLPGKLLSAIAAGGNSTSSLAAAGLTVLLYAVIALGGALWIFRQRDVPT
jgi:ABC-2 type transport system permease protein